MEALQIIESSPQTIRKRDYVNRFKDNQPKDVLFEDFIELAVTICCGAKTISVVVDISKPITLDDAEIKAEFDRMDDPIQWKYP